MKNFVSLRAFENPPKLAPLRRELDETSRLLAESDARIEHLRQRVAAFETATLRAKSVLREFEDTRL